MYIYIYIAICKVEIASWKTILSCFRKIHEIRDENYVLNELLWMIFHQSNQNKLAEKNSSSPKSETSLVMLVFH